MLSKRLIKSNDEGAAGPSFNTVLYEGNELNNGPILDVGFVPDFVWIKSRETVKTHRLHDVIRGGESTLFSDTTEAENVTSFERIDFDYSSTQTRITTASIGWNESGIDYVAWCWKAGGDAVTIPQGTVGNTIASEVSANVDAGFSIVKYTGNGVNGETIGHGLDDAPKMIIIKSSSNPSGWTVYNESVGNDRQLRLDTADAQSSPSIYWFNNTSPTSSVFSIGENINISSWEWIAYCFAEVAGFSKFGSYSGSSGDVYVNTGFEPAFVMVKSSTGTYSWYIIDNKRGATSPTSNSLFANLSNAEAGGYGIYFDSTGFTVSSGVGSGTNSSGQTYIYMAFADQF